MGQNNIVLFQSQDGQIRLEVNQAGETVWLRQEQIAELFGKDISGISRHISKIFKDGELDEESNLQKMQIPFSDKPVNFYSLDIILAVGYRANSRRAIEFRRWATSILKEYLIKGFAMDDERLKQLGGGGYWKELLDRIRDIRSSERVIYRQVLDIQIVREALGADVDCEGIDLSDMYDDYIYGLKKLADINREFSEKHAGSVVSGELTKSSGCAGF